MKKLLLFFLIPFNVFSQNESSAKAVINRTTISINKAQKEIIARHSPQKPLQLSLAVKYQTKAVEEFKKNEYSLAVCYSLKAREYSNEILSSIKIKGLDFYLLNDEEKAILKEANCLAQENFLKTNINSDLIDNTILLDPTKLSENYKINLN